MTRVALLLVALVLAGCPAATVKKQDDDPDARRLAVMRDEPLVARDAGASIDRGFVISATLPAHRSMVTAEVFDAQAQNANEVARKQTSDTMIALRENGWVIYLAACLAPGTTPSNEDDVVGFQYEDGWAFAAYAYKILDGVSYNAALIGTGRSGRAKLSLRLIAPHSAEPRADVFPDRPAALEPGKSCIETSLPPTARVVTGTSTLMDEVGPHPAGTAKPAGRR